MNYQMLAAICITFAGGTMASQEASAALAYNITNGTGSCQAALPNYEGNLRKRPTAIANEGTASAFVSCSIAQNYAGNQPFAYAMIINNNSAVDVVVTCTLVAGLKINGDPAPVYWPQTFTVAAGDHVDKLWYGAANGGQDVPLSANWSCSLPVGAEIGATYIIVEEPAS